MLDANILIRAVFGVQVQDILDFYCSSVGFYTPEICVKDARRHIALLAARRDFSAAEGLDTLDRILQLVEVVEVSLYEAFEVAARRRISLRDADDWPIVAYCLLLNCPVWTEDQDFFGSGIATWTTNNIQLYLSDV